MYSPCFYTRCNSILLALKFARKHILCGVCQSIVGVDGVIVAQLSRIWLASSMYHDSLRGTSIPSKCFLKKLGVILISHAFPCVAYGLALLYISLGCSRLGFSSISGRGGSSLSFAEFQHYGGNLLWACSPLRGFVSLEVARGLYRSSNPFQSDVLVRSREVLQSACSFFAKVWPMGFPDLFSCVQRFNKMVRGIVSYM